MDGNGVEMNNCEAILLNEISEYSWKLAWTSFYRYQIMAITLPADDAVQVGDLWWF